MGAVESAQTHIVVPVIWVRNGRKVAVVPSARRRIDGTRVGVRCHEREIVPDSGVQLDLQPVVVRILGVFGHDDRVETAILHFAVVRTTGVTCDKARKNAGTGKIGLAVVVLMPVLIAYISDGENRPCGELPLNTNAVLIAGGTLVIAISQSRDAADRDWRRPWCCYRGTGEQAEVRVG